MAEEAEEKKVGTEEEEQEEAPEKKGGGLIKIIIFVVVIGVVLAGGWFVGQAVFFSGGEPEENGEEDDQAEEETADLFDRQNHPGTLEFSQSFLIKLQREESVLQGETYLKANLTLEVKDAEIGAEMSESGAVMSRISDTIISYFSSKIPASIETANWPRVKRELMSEINRQLPKDYHIVRVNFKEFIMQQK